MFRDRHDAGRQLAALLTGLGAARPLVLALPRGGVPVAVEVARALGAPLDVLVVRKLGAPAQPELGLGALAEDGTVWVDRELCRSLGVSDDQLQVAAEREAAEAARRVRLYRGGRPLPELAGRTVLIVDDGVAMGGTARAAIRAAVARGAGRVVFAAPVVSAESLAALRREGAEVMAVVAPAHMMSIGSWYQDFHQIDDDEVVALLGDGEHDVEVIAGDVTLAGSLGVPEGARGLVLFAHGSGSGRRSPRNRAVARALRDAGLATLLFDLLTDSEAMIDAHTAELRFDVALLARRLGGATAWALESAETRGLPIGFFGASTGAAAALIAAAALPDVVAAVVSRGGRPDLAAEALARVRAPTLLIVGGDDPTVLVMNRKALAALHCEKELVVVPNAGHLFQEPGALAAVATHAARWFVDHLDASRAGLTPP